MTDTTELRDHIARAIAEVDGRHVDDDPVCDASYPEMADAVMAIVGPAVGELAAARVALGDYERNDESVMADAYRVSEENGRLLALVDVLGCELAEVRRDLADYHLAADAEDDLVDDAASVSDNPPMSDSNPASSVSAAGERVTSKAAQRRHASGGPTVWLLDGGPGIVSRYYRETNGLLETREPSSEIPWRLSLYSSLAEVRREVGPLTEVTEPPARGAE